MKFTCDQCQAQYMISDEKVGPKGVKVRCKKCGNIITVKKDGSDVAADASAPMSATNPAGTFDDMFTGGGQQEDKSYERAATKVFTTAELQRVRDEQVRAGVAPEQPAAAGALGAAVAAAAPATSPDEKPEWYVAINDDQVGPIAKNDLQARWDKGEVKRDTLAWRQGLADWQPVSAIGDLAWLTQRPQAVASKPEVVVAPVVAAAEPAKPVEPTKPAVTWRPQGASALADLAKVAVEEPKKEPAPNPLGDFTPAAAGSDSFGGMPSFNQGPSTVWQMPQAAPRRGGNNGVLIAVLVLLFVLVIGGGTTAFFLLRGSPQAAKPVVAQNPVPPPVTPPAGTAIPGQPGAVPAQPGAPGQPGQPLAANPAVPNPYAQVPSPPGQPGVPPLGGKGPRHVKGVAGAPGDKPADAPAPPPPTGGKKKGGDLDGLFNDKPAAAGKATLDRNDVLGVVRSNIPSFKGCVEKFAAGGKTVPPKLILKFVIVPSGNTSGAEMATPELKGTSVDGCVVSIIKSMKFPEYQSGNIPVTFPIPIGQ